MKTNKKLFLALLWIVVLNTLTLVGCGDVGNPGDDDNGNETPSSPNILFIIADDMGFDVTNGFPEGDQKPFTPHLDAIMNNGLTFTNFWVNPSCIPTRASIISGKYGINTGVLGLGDALSSEHTVLQSYINQNTSNAYATAVIGKWHIADSDSFNPETLGIDYYAGLISGSVNSYTSWGFTEDGITTTETEYATKKFTDVSIDWIQQQSQPWFLWLAYNAPHRPFHVPPAEMHNQGDLPDNPAAIDANPLPYYLAAIEAMDYQIGELLASLSPEELSNTQIIFIGDNGTPGQVAQFPYSRSTAKGSTYQGGVNVPMFIAGSKVTRTGIDTALINGTDLYATIASMAGVSVQEIHDSKNFEGLLSEPNPNQEFYNLSIDPNENTNLLRNNNTLTTEEMIAKEVLEAQLINIRQ